MAWSPVASFSKWRLLPKIIFAAGGVFFLAAVFLWRIELVLTGAGVMLLAMWLNSILGIAWWERGSAYAHQISWEALWQGVLVLLLAGVCLYVAVYKYRFGVLPPVFQSAPRRNGDMKVD